MHEVRLQKGKKEGLFPFPNRKGVWDSYTVGGERKFYLPPANGIINDGGSGRKKKSIRFG